MICQVIDVSCSVATSGAITAAVASTQPMRIHGPSLPKIRSSRANNT